LLGAQGAGTAWQASHAAHTASPSITWAARWSRHPCFPRVTRRVINERTFGNRKLDGRAYLAFFRN